MKCLSYLLVGLLSISIGASAAGASAKRARPARQTATLPVVKPDIKKEADCGCEVRIPADALAVVNGVKISPKDIDDQIKAEIAQLENEIVEARKHQLDGEIDDRVMQAEAKKRGVSVTKLIDLEISPKVTKPTDAEAQDFYDKHKDQMGTNFDEVKRDIAGYLLGQRTQEEIAKFAGALRTTYAAKILEADVAPPANAAERSRVLATVAGDKITSGDLEDDLAPSIFSVQQQVYDLRRARLDMAINDTLLGEEAARRGVTPKALLDEEVVSKIKQVTDEEVKDFYDKNKERIPQDFDSIKAKIIAYLENKEQQDAEGVFADKLRKAATVKIYLKPPEPPVLSISTDDRPYKGKVDAPVTIVEFTDYQCPSCAALQPVLSEIMGEYGDKIRLVVRDFPLDRHENALRAAQAAEAARAQGKYWEYTEVLFHNQTALQDEKLRQYASALGLDMAKFNSALDSSECREAVKRDLDDGNRLGIDATPTVFINGRKFIGDKTHDNLKAAIDRALAPRTKQG